jgi:hypothetical protein
VTALVHPFLLARLVSGVAASILLLAAVRTAVRVLRRWRVGSLAEGQITLARRAELVAALVQTALGIAILGLALTVLAADRLSGSIRGAMCAYGVLASTPTGFAALATSAAAALACVLWLVLHRLDLRLREPVLTRRKFVALLGVAPLVWLDLWTTARFAADLDLGVVSSCCSVSLDDADVVLGAARSGTSHVLWSAAGVLGALAALGAALFVRRHPGGASALPAALLSAAAAVAAVPATLFVVAPYAYETPSHLCPFCLLRADVWGLGWPLFVSLFAGTALGLGIGVAELQRRASGEPREVSGLQARLATWTAGAWAAFLVFAAAPVVRFVILTGDAALLGGP